MAAPDDRPGLGPSPSPGPAQPSSIIDTAVPLPKPEPPPPRLVITGWRPFLRDLARHPLSWPLPAWLVFGIMLVLGPDLWIDEVVGDYAMTLALLSIGYWAAPFVVNYTRYTTAGLRAPSDEEVGCAIWLWRAMMLVGLYVMVGHVVVTYL